MNANVFLEILARIDRRELAAAADLMRRTGLDTAAAPQALYLQGVMAYAQGDARGAKVKFARAAKGTPQSSLPLIGLGNACLGLDDPAGALKAYRAALALEPENPAILNNIGSTETTLGHLDAAEAALTKALAIAPTNPAALKNLARVKRRRDDHAAADALIELLGDSADGLMERAAMRLQFGDGAEAVALVRRAVAAGLPPELEHDAGAILLRTGHLGEGFALMGVSPRPGAPTPPLPLWSGEAPETQRLVVLVGQDADDMFQLARFLPRLAETVAEVRLLAPPRLRRLFDSLPGNIRIAREVADVETATAYVPIAALPRLVGVASMADLAAPPYLSADEERRALWRPRLPRGRMRVGIAWAANGATGGGGASLGDFAPEAAVADVALVSLQLGISHDVYRAQRHDVPVTTFSGVDEGPDGLLDTTAIMSEMDLVITSDTAVACLAGALGVPVWLLLPRQADWRWFEDRDDSPWYPSMRLFRQQVAGDGTEVHARVAAALADAVAEKMAAEARA
jgi:tetratricopeptide (TPR) repeat protein